MFLRRVRSALDLETTPAEARPETSSRLLRQVRSGLDLGPATAESRRRVALLLPWLGPLVLAATLAPALGRQAGLAPWVILGVQGLAIAGLLGIVAALARRRSP